MFIYITYPNVRLAPTFSTYVCSVLLRRQMMNFPPSGWIMKHATPRKNFATVSPSHVCLTPTGTRHYWHFCKQATTHDRHIRASSLSFTPQAPPHMRCKICTCPIELRGTEEFGISITMVCCSWGIFLWLWQWWSLLWMSILPHSMFTTWSLAAAARHQEEFANR